jgi:hypothetical protein
MKDGVDAAAELVAELLASRRSRAEGNADSHENVVRVIDGGDVRVTVEAAIASGDEDSIVASYLELVRALLEGHKLDAAIDELERGLEILRPGLSTRSATPEIWRLQLCLAALYSGVGHTAQARSAAIIGQAYAVNAGSTIGRRRAHDLLARLSRRK